VIKKAGNSYSYKEEKLGVGRENAKLGLRGDKKMMKEIEKEVLKAASTAEALGELPTSGEGEE
jgi:hypothetical protein